MNATAVPTPASRRKGGDATSRLHGGARLAQPVAQEGGTVVEILDQQGQAPEA